MTTADQGDDEMPTRTKIIIVVVIMVVIGALTFMDHQSKGRNKLTGPQEQQHNTRQWTNVLQFTGNGTKKSATFDLLGGEARLKYSYKGMKGVGGGLFAIYVVAHGDDINKTGGFPEIMTQAESEESVGTIQHEAGRYYLNVNAVGNWSVIVEELR
jgi:hypothetical protein